MISGDGEMGVGGFGLAACRIDQDLFAVVKKEHTKNIPFSSLPSTRAIFPAFSLLSVCQ